MKICGKKIGLGHNNWNKMRKMKINIGEFPEDQNNG